MAVWGISILILSLTFLIHRHPPNTWRLSWTLLPPPDSKDIKATLEKHGDKIKSRERQRMSDEKTAVREEPEIKVEEEDSDDQKTPQAKPAAPSMAVPSFSLDLSNTTIAPSFSLESPKHETDPSIPATGSKSMPPPPKLLSKPATAPSSQPRTAPSSLMPPPSFPAPNSAQRASQSSSLMPPPSRPARSTLGVPAIPSRQPPLSSAAQARAPPPRIDTPKSSSSKVKLAPGFSPLDWASLAASKNLANVPSFTRVTPSMLAEKNGRKGNDAWSVYNGKVYNITPYAPFHPGGKGELLRAAGKDGTKLFLEVHPWVNWEGMLNSCLVGVMVSESEGEGLDAMD
jgi:cytochrome b involved in lipid metabolism